jgi:diguanylate cyclase (GGDEF)-like protein
MSWMSGRVVARVAVAALATGLALLAALAVVSTRTTARSAAQVAETEQISQQWSDVYLRISVEYEHLVDFLRADDDASRMLLISSIGSAEDILRWLNAHGSRVDSQHARALQNTYGGYSYTLRSLVDADSRHDRAEVDLDARQAALSASALRKQASVNVARKSQEMGATLRKAQDRSHKLLVGVEIISGVDLALVTLCALFLLAYQRHTEWQAAQSRHRATHDALTGAANRALLGERVDAALATAARDGSKVGLLLLDLNRFKDVNDTLGHHIGDLLLREVATRLRHGARQSDTVARLGGDEFAVVLPDLAGPEDLLAVGQRVLDAVCGVANLQGVAVDVSASIGAALYPDPSTSAMELMQYADIAMYTAKRGRLGIALYDPGADDSPERLATLGELRHAIQNDELELLFQPKVEAGTRRLAGAEALVRWRHPARGLLEPDKFVPVADQGGLMTAMTDRILTTALEQYEAWKSQGLWLPLAVNVGAACLLDKDFPTRVATLLREHHVPAADLTLEITETALVTDPAPAAAGLAALRDLGVKVSIDDFGTGWSALGHLQTMPLDELKIDHQFTARMFTADNGQAMVSAIIQLAHASSLRVVVEGVEDERTLLLVELIGGDVAQGHHICKPLPAADVASWAANWQQPSMAV